MIYDRTIHELIKRGLLVDVDRDGTTSEVLTGKLLALKEDFLYMAQYDHEGRYDGISVSRTYDVTRVRWGGVERDAVTRLIEAGGDAPVAPRLAMASLPAVIREIDEHFGHVELHCEDVAGCRMYIGEVDAIDEDGVRLFEYGSKLSLDRHFGLYRMEHVTRTDADSIYTRNLLRVAPGSARVRK